ncbi:ZDHHC7 [Cordylochernes scorpioides]|uniref:ZDHHC7 n=1 Tax=Cordylochernes scorpioides TaxID=51811 RepID=A0ABY6LU06_9ARAC|nr:ZDHHC7 [Cordylochernes scorpioides]
MALGCRRINARNPLLPTLNTGAVTLSGSGRNQYCSGRWWFVKDICGIICALVTWFLIIYAQYVVVYLILLPQIYSTYGFSNFIIFEILSFLAVSAHLKTMFTDPVSVNYATH